MTHTTQHFHYYSIILNYQITPLRIRITTKTMKLGHTKNNLHIIEQPHHIIIDQITYSTLIFDVM